MVGIEIKNLKQLSAADVKTAGGKAVNLGAMIRAGIPAPAGFVIPARALAAFLRSNDLNGKIAAALQPAKLKNIQAIENTAEKIKKMIMAGRLPVDLQDQILKNYTKLGARFTAVRSSAAAEDSAAAAWAGQLDSFLNITQDQVLEKVKKCWASFFSARTIDYRLAKKIPLDQIAMAVIVQKMINSDKAGVAFSQHPATQAATQIVIEAGFGLGQAVAGGMITPDHYVVDKNKLAITAVKINGQQQALYARPARGIEWRDLGAKRGRRVLAKPAIIELAKLVRKIEHHFGYPCDIEWAMEKNIIYITQCRPITGAGLAAVQPLFGLDYIKSQKWFAGIRTDDSLFYYSAKCSGYNQYVKKQHGVEFADTILAPVKKNHLTRFFNLEQAKLFHSVSTAKILKNPRALISNIEKNDLIYRRIENQGARLTAAIKKNNYQLSVRLFNEICRGYEIAASQFIIIFSLGLKLTENQARLKNNARIVKQHDVWRNSAAFKEEKMGEDLFDFFRYAAKVNKIKIQPRLLIKFLTIKEVRQWLNHELANARLVKIIKARQAHGFVYWNLRNEPAVVVDQPADIKAVRKYLASLNPAAGKRFSGSELSGQTAYGTAQIITGRVIVIKNKAELKNKAALIRGKILVAVQTTPHYIPYLKKAKAIITDEGGLTCHAAILARELKITAVIGTKKASSLLKDNDLIQVDAGAGVIKVLKSAPRT